MMVKYVSIAYALSSMIVVQLLTYLLSVLHPAFSFEEDTHIKLRPSKLISDTNHHNKESLFLINMLEISVNVL
jgi:hypothetical protein